MRLNSLHLVANVRALKIRTYYAFSWLLACLILMPGCISDPGAIELNRVKNSCEKLVDRCEAITNPDVFTARLCAKQLQTCENDSKVQGKQWARFYAVRDRHKVVAQQFIIPPKMRIDQCQSGLRWSYRREKHISEARKLMERINSTVNFFSNLYGNYTSQEQCEEARIVDKNKSAGKWDISHECVLTFQKKKLTHTVFKLSGIDELNQEFSVKLDTRNDCEVIKTNGYSYVTYGTLREMDVSPVGSTKKPRFVGNCMPINVDVCVPKEHYYYPFSIPSEENEVFYFTSQ